VAAVVTQGMNYGCAITDHRRDAVKRIRRGLPVALLGITLVVLGNACGDGRHPDPVTCDLDLAAGFTVADLAPNFCTEQATRFKCLTFRVIPADPTTGEPTRCRGIACEHPSCPPEPVIH